MTSVERVLLDECVKEHGFMMRIREGVIAIDGYERIRSAIQMLAAEPAPLMISRLAVACLFEVPWELENCVDFYTKKNPSEGLLVNEMAETLRSEIHELLWRGLDDHYK